MKIPVLQGPPSRGDHNMFGLFILKHHDATGSHGSGDLRDLPTEEPLASPEAGSRPGRSPRPQAGGGPLSAPTSRSRADIHVHCKYSDRPSEWILRRIGSPESFVEPIEVYEAAKARGMDFVTISDHNRIEGALDIAHLPDTFISTEVTTYFPEDGCKVHCLVTGITEEQFRVIQELRPSIYEFRRYLAEQDIIYSLAHPLFQVNDRMSVDHVEKLILLFDRFEAINGTRDRRGCEIAHALLSTLSREQVEEMANRQGLAPVGRTPWLKSFTGGSDDHSGHYIAHAYTETPRVGSVAEFLAQLRAGNHRPGGDHGTSLLLAHCFYQIGFNYYQRRLLGRTDHDSLITQLFQRLSSDVRKRPEKDRSLGRRMRRFAERVVPALRFRGLSQIERQLLEEFSQIVPRSLLLDDPNSVDRPPMDDQRVFQLSCHLSQNVAHKFLENIVANVKRGKLLESLQSFVALAPIGMAITPYICAFSAQHKDERFLRQVADHFPGLRQYRRDSARKAWFTDTFTDVNGVTNTIRRVAQIAKDLESSATIITCLSNPPEVDLPLKNFPPIGEAELPEYRSQKISFPPFLEILRWVEEQGFREIIISTPGPMGLVGLAAAKLLRLRAVGIYHTHFPEYVTQLTGDPAIGAVTGRYMKWFYGQLDRIQVPSEAARDHLVANGYAADRLTVIGRGVDTELFHPGKRSEVFWRRYGAESRFQFLFVGRVSREKNIEFLLEAFAHLRARGSAAELMVVGDGPLLGELRRGRRRDGVHFIGALSGEALSAAYASSDVFVFPSLTDTYGNVVLEAHASGLPAVVLHGAGPGEIVRRHGSGIVVLEQNAEWYAEAMAEMATDAARRAELRRAALAAAAASRWENVVEEMWCSLDGLSVGSASRLPAHHR